MKMIGHLLQVQGDSCLTNVLVIMEEVASCCIDDLLSVLFHYVLAALVLEHVAKATQR